MRLGAPATLIEYSSMKFVITYMPDVICPRQYIKDLQQYDVQKLVNACGCTYSPQMFTSVGITVIQLPFPDGTFPSPDIAEQWMGLVKQHFALFPNTALAVHDYSGLGRSAVLVAIALMENGMKSQEAIDMIRTQRRGAFNAYQLEELGKYKPKNRPLEREKSKIFLSLCAKNPSEPQ